MDPIPLPGLPCLASVGEDVPSLAVTLCAMVGWYTGEASPFSEEKGGKAKRRGYVREERGCCDWDIK